MEENKTQDQNNPYLIPGAIIVAGVLIAGAVVYSIKDPDGAVTRRQPAAAAVADSGGSGVAGDLEDDDPMLGNPEAPVALVEFSDFQCPFCRRMYGDALPLLKEKYIKTGKIKFIYRDFPLTSIHSLAQKYAEAGECADEQGKFWPMHDKIFDEQNSRGQGTITDFSVEDIKRWALEIGLEGVKFDECLDSGKYTEEVSKDFRDGQNAGVQGTPATFVNGRLISGAVPISVFEQAIEEELAKVK